ncbi:hypothetical protein, partial [Streptomyces sp. NPDC005322]|uniref:hypothetical protein n=1 Tax=Streptomyces sp. NPDC005322 TaxID=3157032 RepID=UPI0033A5704B
MPVAVRPPRAAGARRQAWRALLVVLFLRVALAFLFGGSAHLAERGESAGPAADQKAVRPVREPIEQEAQKITEPVGGLVRDTAGDRQPVRLPDVGLGELSGAGQGGSTPGQGPAGARSPQGDTAPVREA